MDNEIIIIEIAYFKGAKLQITTLSITIECQLIVKHQIEMAHKSK